MPLRTQAVPGAQQKVVLLRRRRRTHTASGEGQQLEAPSTVITWPGGQQAPLRQAWPAGQQVEPQGGWPGGQFWQTPLTQPWPLGQQVLPQAKVPVGQPWAGGVGDGPVHTPLTQL